MNVLRARGMGWLSFLLSLGMALGSAQADRAKEASMEPPPPLPQTVGVQVFRGESVRIPLQARGRLAAESRFIIRNFPTLGSLGSVMPHRPGIALVEYTHRGGATDEADEFTYAAQAPGTPVSAPARVVVRIVDRPAELRHPEEIDFGEVLVGETVRQYLFLQNLGGMPLRTKVSVEPEWILPKGTEIVIPPGGEVEWPVEFAPQRAGEFLGVVRFSHQDRAIVRLVARGRETLRWIPQSLEIRQDGEVPVNPAVTLTNRTDEDIDLTIQIGEGLSGPESVRVPAGESESVRFSLAHDLVKGAQGDIVFTHKWGQARVPYQIFPQPGKLLILPSNGIEFESIAPRGMAQAQVLLENRGGLPITLAMESSPGVEIRGEQNFSLLPGAQRSVELQFSSRQSGDIAGEIRVRWGAHTDVIPWRGVVGETRDQALTLRGTVSENQEHAPSLNPPPQHFPGGHSVAQGSQERPAQTGPVPWEDLQLLVPMPNSLVLEWKAPIKAGQEIHLQTRIWGMNAAGNPELTWVPMPNVDVFVPRDGEVRATLYRLVPDSRLLLRFQVRSPTGRLEVESEMLALSIPAKESGWRIPWLALLVMLAIAAGGWIWRRRQAAEKAEAEAAYRRLDLDR